MGRREGLGEAEDRVLGAGSPGGRPARSSFSVCLSNATTGRPFISTLELRPLNGSLYRTDGEARAFLALAARINSGAPSPDPATRPRRRAPVKREGGDAGRGKRSPVLLCPFPSSAKRSRIKAHESRSVVEPATTGSNDSTTARSIEKEADVSTSASQALQNAQPAPITDEHYKRSNDALAAARERALALMFKSNDILCKQTALKATGLGERWCQCHVGLRFRSIPKIAMPHRGYSKFWLTRAVSRGSSEDGRSVLAVSLNDI
ncbi:hypothetical protein ZWY2020_007181 [Hordeum vulgare]|nr:hypothetical protein ZWY2020_007181 [Hordeum vulgare]